MRGVANARQKTHPRVKYNGVPALPPRLNPEISPGHSRSSLPAFGLYRPTKSHPLPASGGADSHVRDPIATETSAAATAAGGARPWVLVIENEPTAAALISALLSAAHCDVVVDDGTNA